MTRKNDFPIEIIGYISEKFVHTYANTFKIHNLGNEGLVGCIGGFIALTN